MNDRTAADRETVLVGRVVKPHGIRGEICVESYADSPALFFGLDCVLLRTGRMRPVRHTIRAAREHKGRLLLTLKGVEDRNRAEDLRGMDVLVRRADLPDIGEDEFYLADLLGMRVDLENGEPLGVLESFLETPGQITWSVAHASGREILLPAVEDVILDVDAAAGRVVVRPPEGLVELYLQPRAEKAARNPGRSQD